MTLRGKPLYKYSEQTKPGLLTRRVDEWKTVVTERSPANRVSSCHSENVGVVVTQLVIGNNPLRVWPVVDSRPVCTRLQSEHNTHLSLLLSLMLTLTACVTAWFITDATLHLEITKFNYNFWPKANIFRKPTENAVNYEFRKLYKLPLKYSQSLVRKMFQVTLCKLL